MSETFLNGKVTLLRGDCLELLPTLEENSIDSCVTDPPYHLTSIVKRFANAKPANEAYAATSKSAYMSRGFMGKQWDGGDIAFNPLVWELVFRALKPGAHLLAFSGTRTYHRMACAIEDAGFEIRDQIGWCYGSGFPKSHDVSKGIDRLAGAEREVVSVRKRTGNPINTQGRGGDINRRPWMEAQIAEHGCLVDTVTAPATESAIQWQGWGTALKPAWEPIVLARKPLSESSIAANVLRHGTGGINIDGCRVGADGGCAGAGPGPQGTIYGDGLNGSFAKPVPGLGRWPANLIHDGSEEVVRGFPETGQGHFPATQKQHDATSFSVASGIIAPESFMGDSGSAARFFYTAKADSDDRLGSKHPTVKPVDLMAYLVRLVTPKNGLVLDPFSGTGTTGESAFREGCKAILIEREPEYQSDIVRRMNLCLSGPDERARESIKASGKVDDAGPLFGGVA